MASRTAELTDVHAPTARRRTRSPRTTEDDRATGTATVSQTSALLSTALAFAARCHSGQWRESDGAPFIEHSLEVARLLRDAGCSEVVIAAGLLHDVMEDSHVSAIELTARFGPAVTELVQAVTDNACVESYRQRKQVLREQVRAAGVDAALLLGADKISKVRELPNQIQRDRARFGDTACGIRARDHLERYQQMRLDHYQECLLMVQRVAPGHPLVTRLASELDSCLITISRDAIGGSRGSE